jgi:hypothetical protein
MDEMQEITGEELERQQSLEVWLSSVGNPDHGQDPSRPLFGVQQYWQTVESLGRASAMCRSYIVGNDLGGGNWTGGLVRRRETHEEIATVSYNGRVWRKGSVCESCPISYVIDGFEVYALMDDLDGGTLALNERTSWQRKELEAAIAPRALQPIEADAIDAHQKWLLERAVEVQRGWFRIEQRKRSALKLLAPLGFQDNQDAEEPGAVYLPQTGFIFDCAKGGPGEVMQAAIDFGRKQGEEALQRRLRELLGL